ncbi:hypothetical protein BDR04DRAFT_1116585 [Suillus decipiens]|nr:hypothetical protein BDR04DRAFT_1116585 [Suillus decipiens]
MNQLVFYWPDFGEALSIKDEKLPTALHLVYKAKKHLANCILAHQLVILDIWCQRIQAMNSHLLTVELNVGCLHTEQKKIGISMSMTQSHSDGTTTVGTPSSY